MKHGWYDLGYDLTIEQVHEDCKDRFNRIEIVNEYTGEVKSFINSSAKLTTTEFMVYISKIQQFAAEDLYIEIHDPEIT